MPTNLGRISMIYAAISSVVIVVLTIAIIQLDDRLEVVESQIEPQSQFENAFEEAFDRCLIDGVEDALNGVDRNPSWDFSGLRTWEPAVYGSTTGCELGYLLGYNAVIDDGLTSVEDLNIIEDLEEAS